MPREHLVRRVADDLRPKPVRRAKAEVAKRVPTRRGFVAKAVAELDDQLGVAKFGTQLLNKIFPDHWSFFLGEIALYSFVVLVATGVFLALYFVPSSDQVIYHGVDKALDGQRMSRAYASALDLSFTVRAGLLMRQLHHWAANVFIGAIVVHMCRIYFTSAFRKPRMLNWCVGVTLLMLAVINGYLGYSLPDDLLSGTGVRIGYGILESIPFVGSYLAVWFFRGQFPGTGIYLERFFLLHVFVIPLLIFGLLGAHLAMIFHQEHTQWPGKHEREDNVVGSPMWPNFVAKTTGLFLMVAGTLTLLAGIFQIDPIWQYGYYDPARQSTAAQPDFYMGWLEGALRMMPSWEWQGFGHTVVWVTFLSAVVLPTLAFATLYAVPFVERWFTKESVNHHLLVPPRFRPAQTALGAAGVAFYFILLFDGGDDVIAHFFHLSLNDTVWALRVATFVLPTLAGLLAYRVCLDLQRIRQPRDERRRAVLRWAEGRFFEVRPERPAPAEDGLAPTEVPNIVVSAEEASGG